MTYNKQRNTLSVDFALPFCILSDVSSSNRNDCCYDEDDLDRSHHRIFLHLQCSSLLQNNLLLLLFTFGEFLCLFAFGILLFAFGAFRFRRIVTFFDFACCFFSLADLPISSHGGLFTHTE